MLKSDGPNRVFLGPGNPWTRYTCWTSIYLLDLGGCVPLPEWTGMDIITGMDYRNGHHAMALGALNVFCLHKMYFCSDMNSLHQTKFISV